MKNDYRQKLHLEPKKGWLNDPNGLCFFKGEYHVYFQYSPGSAEGKTLKHWGHFKSPDLIHWEFTGAVLFPDIPEDRDGVYSGCGLVKDDTLYLFYTGNVKEKGDYDYINSGRGANVILVTTKDGHNMSEKKVLLRNSDYPDYCSCHVRDPKVWEEDGKYRMILGARTRDSKSCALLYISDDLINWKYDCTLFGYDGSYMWECPDMFDLNGERFLSVSPQGLTEKDAVVNGWTMEKHIYQNVYSSGLFRLCNGIFRIYHEWDYGFDFYAPQTFDAPDGRKLLIGWEGIGDIPYHNATTELGWQHCLTLIRELTYENDKGMMQNPVKEYEKLRGESKAIHNGDTFKTSLPFDFTGKTDGDFSLILSDILKIGYKDELASLTFISDKAGCGRTSRFAELEECKDIRIIADASSIEIYLNGGEKVLSSRMYPEDTEIELSAEGIEGTIYSLGSLEVTFDE